MDLYKRIQDLKKEKKKRDSEMAHALDMEQSNYVRVEKKGERLTYEQIEKIAAGLGISTKELLFGEDAIAQTVNTKEIEDLRKEILIKDKDIKILTLEANEFKNEIEFQSLFVEFYFCQDEEEKKEIEKKIVSIMNTGFKQILDKFVKKLTKTS